MATQTVVPRAQENLGIPLPNEHDGSVPFMLTFAEPMFGKGFKGQTYSGSTSSRNGETGDFDNDN